MDFVEAFCAALVSQEGGGTDLQALTKSAKRVIEEDEAVSANEETVEDDHKMFDSVTNEYSFIMAEKTAGEILHDEDGKFALRAVHRLVAIYCILPAPISRKTYNTQLNCPKSSQQIYELY